MRNTHTLPSAICLPRTILTPRRPARTLIPGGEEERSSLFSGFIRGGGTTINSYWWQEAGNDLSSTSYFLPIKGGSLWPVQLWSRVPEGRFWDWWLLPSCGTSGQFQSTHFITGTGHMTQKQEGRQIQGFTPSSLPPGNLTHPGTEPASLTSPLLADGFSTTSTTREVEEGMATHSSIPAQRWATVHGVAQTWTRQSNLACTHAHTHTPWEAHNLAGEGYNPLTRLVNTSCPVTSQLFVEPLKCAQYPMQIGHLIPRNTLEGGSIAVSV